MRLGLLGSSNGDIAALARGADFLLNGAKVTRALYLGGDGALDRAVYAWARRLVADDPSDEALWARAARLAVQGSGEEIERALPAEHARIRLRALETLPARGVRTVEMLGDRVVLLLYDKAALDEEDILGAHVLIYGKSDEALVKRIGPRWFATPGRDGVAVLDDEGDAIQMTLYDAAGSVVSVESLTAARTTKMRVQGAGG